MKVSLRPKYQTGGFSSASLIKPGSLGSSTYSSWKPSTNPSVANPQRYTGYGGSSEEVGMGGGNEYGQYIQAAANAIGNGIGIANTAKSDLSEVKTSKDNYANYKRYEGLKRLSSLPYSYPKMQTGGSNPYAGTWDPNALNTDPNELQSEAQKDITLATTEAIASSVPVIGPVIGAATGAQKSIRGMLGEKETQNSEGQTVQTYDSVDKAIVGNLVKPAHEQGLEHAKNKDYGRAVLSFAGLGTFADAHDAAQDTQQALEEEIQNKTSVNVGRTLGNTTYSRGNIQYAKGGLARIPNAEVEHNEVVEEPDGTYETKKGRKHNYSNPKKSGIKIHMDPGSYVWSEELGFADRFKELKENDAPDIEIENLRMEQEMKAGRMPKYQTGGFGKGYLRSIQSPGENYFPYPSALHKEVDLAFQADNVPKKKVTSVKTKPKGRDTSKDLVYTPMPVRPLSSTVEPEPVLSPVGNPTASNMYKTRNRYERTGAGRFLKDNSDVLIAGAGAIGQLVGNLVQKPGDIAPVKSGSPVKADNVHYTRVKDMEKGAREAELRAATKTSLLSGSGPGANPAYARAAMTKHRQTEEAAGRIDNMNAQIDMSERSTNVKNKLSSDMFNAEMAMRTDASRRDEELRKRNFKNAKAASIGDTIGGVARDALAYNADRDLSKAVYGDSGINERYLKGKENQFYKDYRMKNPKATPAEINTAWLNELSKMT